MIHKKILDYASEHPDASIEAIAEEVSGTSPTFVERVFEKYGDPANTDRNQAHGNGSDHPPGETGSDTDSDDDVSNASRSSPLTAATSQAEASEEQQPHADGGEPDRVRANADGGYEVTVDGTVIHLTEKQYTTLRAVAERPSATQGEIADTLGVSRATISKRLNDVEKFDWQTRRPFVEQAFAEDALTQAADGGTAVANRRDESVTEREAPETDIADLERRIDALEDRIADGSTGANEGHDPELLHKLIHASMDAEYISQAEELRLIRELLPDGDVEDT